MASEYSFDVVSDFDKQELVNALDQVKREIGARYDFKGVTADVELEKDSINITTGSDMQLKAIIDVLQSKLAKRGIDMKILDPQKVEDAAKGNVRQEVKLRKGIDSDGARDLVKKIKAEHPKVQVKIQDDQLRVSSKDKDTLQNVQQFLRDMDLDRPLQFTNYR